jgi:hypothetical protein
MRRPWLCLLLVGFVDMVSAADIDVVSTWSPTLNDSNLLDGAGTPLVAHIDSFPGAATLTISGAEGAHWQVQVARRDAGNWPDGVEIEVKYSGNDATIVGGTGYLTLSSGLQPFIEGTGNHATIDLQLRLRGLTLQHRAGGYHLAIDYQIVLIP